MAKQSPEKVFRIGAVSASVFVHELDGDNGTRQLRNVSLQRSYRDNGETKYAGSFGLAELPALAKVVQLATDYVASKEAEVK